MCTLAASISRLVKPTAESRSKPGAAIASASMPSWSRMKSSPKVHLLKANLMSNAVGSAFSTLAIASSVKPLAFSVEALMPGRIRQRAVAHRVSLDLGDLAFAVAEHAQRRRHRLVDDLPVAAAGELLELHQREVRLDAGGVAIHHEADGAGRARPRWSAHCGNRWSRRARARRPRLLSHARRCRPAGRRRGRAGQD